MGTRVTINREQELYVIPCGTGYSCLGFDVCLERSAGYAKWLGVSFVPAERGSIEAYNQYLDLLDNVSQRNKQTGERCPSELCSQLIGLENKRVEVADAYGETRRFYVGKSTGYIPIHLEISRRNSSGGPAVTGTPFKSVRVVGAR